MFYKFNIVESCGSTILYPNFKSIANILLRYILILRISYS
nr:MAG TPA: hypothetical protein [Caudoviricetes sp.]